MEDGLELWSAADKRAQLAALHRPDCRALRMGTRERNMVTTSSRHSGLAWGAVVHHNGPLHNRGPKVHKQPLKAVPRGHDSQLKPLFSVTRRKEIGSRCRQRSRNTWLTRHNTHPACSQLQNSPSNGLLLRCTKRSNQHCLGPYRWRIKTHGHMLQILLKYVKTL